MKRILLTFLGLVAMLLPAHADIIIHADYNDNFGTSNAARTDGFDGYDLSNGAILEAVQGNTGGRPEARSGAGMVYFEIHTSDSDFGASGAKRAEVSADHRLADMQGYYDTNNGFGIMGDIFWYAFSIYVPSVNCNDGKQVMAQWISRWDNGGYNEGNTMAIELENGNWRLTVQRSRSPDVNNLFSLGTVQKDAWTDFVVQVRWDMDNYSADGNNGFVRVWKNGSLFDNGGGNTVTGTNCFEVDTVDEQPALKFGVYKRFGGSNGVSWCQSTKNVYFDEIKIGDASETLATMSPGPTQPDIVTSLSNIDVPEGGTASFDVSLSNAPETNVTVSVARTAGDTDLTVQSGASLSFSTTNWDTAQTVTLAAAQDADGDRDTATFSLTGTDLGGATVTAKEDDDEAPPDASPEAVDEDTYVRGGSYAADNYGSSAVLEGKDGFGTDGDWDREIYLKFDLNTLSSVPDAVTLELVVDGGSDTGDFTLHAVSDDSWGESSLTFNSSQASLGASIGSGTITTTGQTLQLDVTSYIVSEYHGDGIATIGISADGDYWTSFVSREGGTAPRLVFTGGGAAAPPSAPTISAQPSPQTVTEGDPASFSVVADGNPAPTYQWRKDGSSISGANGSTYSIATTVLADAGSYDVLVTNSEGSVTSATATLTVNAAPPPPADASPETVADDAYVRGGSYVSDNYGSAGDLQAKDGFGTDGDWDREVYLKFALNTLSSVPDAVTLELVVDGGSDTGSFTLHAVSDDSWSESTLTFNSSQASLGASIGSGTITATGQTLQLDVTSYIVSEYHGDGIATIGISADGDYWTSFVSKEGGTAPRLVFTGGGSSAPPAAPTISAQPSSQTVTAGISASFSVTAAGNPAPSYQWRKDGVGIVGATAATYSISTAAEADEGAYDVVVTNSEGSVTSTTATLTVQVAPVITDQPDSTSVSPGANVTFSVTATGDPAPTYQWRKDGSDLAGATASTLSLTQVQPADEGAYDVVVTNAAGSITSQQALLNILSAPVILDQPDAITLVVGDDLTLSVVATGDPSPTYQWRQDGTNIPGATSTTLTVTDVQVTDAGTYDVVVSNSEGSVTSDPAVVTVTEPSNVEIWLEAEDADSLSSPFVTESDSSAFGASKIAVRNVSSRYSLPSGSGEASWTFNVSQAGDYYLWGRLYGTSSGNDSVYVRMDGGSWTNWNLFPTYNAFVWDDLHNWVSDTELNPVVYNLSTGSHTLEIAYREVNAEVDILYLTNDPLGVPYGTPGDADPISTTADSYTLGGSASTNYGTEVEMIAKDGSGTNWDRNVYVKFDLGTLNSAPSEVLLELTTTSTSASGSVSIREITDDTWTESGITWNNAPTTGSLIDTLSVAASQAYTVDVTSYVVSQYNGDGTASFVVTDAPDAFIEFTTRESGTPARLLVIGGN